jgi:pimeloyl-ACP methyl ester carboxylesterase
MAQDARLQLMKLGFALGGTLAPGLAADLALKLFTRPPRIDAPPRERELAARGEPLLFRSGLSATAFGSETAKPVLLLHGWAGRGLQLGAFVDPLVAAGYRPIALDGPAHGASPGHETNPVHFAEALVEVGVELGPLASVVAHSFGGATAVLAVQRGMRTDGLVMVASPSDLSRVLRRFSHEIGLPPRGQRKLVELVESRVGAPMEAGDLVRLAPSMTVPLLMIHDPEDPEVPFSDAERLVAAWPGAELFVATGMGHYRVLRRPEAVARVVEFVKAVARGNTRKSV